MKFKMNIQVTCQIQYFNISYKTRKDYEEILDRVYIELMQNNTSEY